MDTGLLHGAANLRAMERRLEAAAMNLANVETPGYKRLRPANESFEAALTRASKLPARYPRTIVARDFAQGPLVTTENARELSLRGEGFFVAEDGRGIKLARHARFEVDPQGYLVLHDGSRLLGQVGPILVPPGSSEMHVTSDGTVSAEGVVVGSLRVVKSDDAQRLVAEGGGAFRPPPADRLPLSDAEVLQGVRERSNVEAVDEMLELMMIQHSFQASSRAMVARSEAAQRYIQQSG
ncbi:MAG: flagellar hook basal-body protein [Planctomycetota bacterium]